MLVYAKAPNSMKRIKTYAILDEESNSSYIHPKLIKMLGAQGEDIEYSVAHVGGTTKNIKGRAISGLTIKGYGQKKVFKLPRLLEISYIPDSRDEVATKSDVLKIPSVAHYADKFNKLNEDAEVLLLLGRNNPSLIATKTYTDYSPIVHENALGFALVGEANPGLDQDCQGRALLTIDDDNVEAEEDLGILPEDNDPVFKEYSDDELLGLSQEDVEFNILMSKRMKINKDGKIQAPLPFKGGKDPIMPNNRDQVFKRTRRTLMNLKTKPAVLDTCLKSMQKSIDRGHVELVPTDELETKKGMSFCLPIFVAPAKNGKNHRLVFDSRAEFEGVSLNSTMQSGPQLENNLKDVLLRFREGPLGFMADAEAFFHSFAVEEKHKDYMRFFWFKNNDPNEPLVLYRATVHIFGNCGSPAVAGRGLKFATEKAEPPLSKEAKTYLERSSYVDDNLGSAKDAKGAISVLKEAKAVLGHFNIRLHKIAASDPEVMEAFPESERATDLIEVDFHQAPDQKSLGLRWNVSKDTFTLAAQVPERPFTRRGVLSVVNSLYDPLGQAAPSILPGRLFQRLILPRKGQGDSDLEGLDFDDPIPERFRPQWKRFLSSLQDLKGLVIPRGFIPKGFGPVSTQEVFAFADGSQDAIGHVLYLRSISRDGKVHVAFVGASSKVAPRSATSIPRLELNSALECALAVQSVVNALDRKPDKVHFFTDSKVVLGYLTNKTKRFARYVTRRVNLIKKASSQWKYVPTEQNIADLASRPTPPSQLLRSRWLQGPDFLWNRDFVDFEETDLAVDELPEEVTETRSMKTHQAPKGSLAARFAHVFEHMSSYTKMLRVAQVFVDWQKRAAHEFKLDAKEVLIKAAQEEVHYDALSSLGRQAPLPEYHPLVELSPILVNGVIRVGGRLDRAKEPFDSRHPYLIPKGHPLAVAILSHFHVVGRHQGRHITHGLVRDAGYHLEKGTTLIKKFLHNCAICRRLRGELATQLMADLPEDRLEATPPFANSAVDTAGPWYIQRGKATRQNPGFVKLWIILFTCLASRAVHVEIVPGLSTSAFKNALYRFIATRGNVVRRRSDQGRNFIGSAEDNSEVDLNELTEGMKKRGVEWIFQPPNAPHFGGVHESKIKGLKKVLEGTMALLGQRRLTYDEFHTLVLEACSIVNSTPLWEVSGDPSDPKPLSPSMLLTLRDSPHPPPPENFTESDLIAYGRKR